MTSELRVIIYDDYAVGVVVGNETGLFEPKIAIEIAQSLISAAKDVDPMIDVAKIMKDYRESHGISEGGH